MCRCVLDGVDSHVEKQEMMSEYYRQDLQKYLEIMDELQHSLMSPRRRRQLENCKEALEIVLDMYVVDLR